VILDKLVVGPYGSNCYIVGSEKIKVGMIIDPGAEGDRILKRVTELNVNIDTIVLTHGHMDHIGALQDVKNNTGAKVAIHNSEAESFASRSSFMFGFSSPSQSMFDVLLNDGDIIKAGDLEFTVIHTPGHTQGGISILGGGIVFTGDTLFNYGIGRYDLPGSSGKQLASSLRRLLELADSIKVYPGHGPDTTIGNERQGNPFLRQI
jgi:glyoxylase-like metal-dependent hydrolase (beta-lactamase superfamily II)